MHRLALAKEEVGSKPLNIAGRQYLTQEAIDEFHRRASAGEFSQAPKVPTRKEAGVGA